MQEKLNRLYQESINELKSIDIDIINNPDIGKINIGFAKRNTKRYGCCRQEDPDINTCYYEKRGRRRYKKYAKYSTHNIEISKWVMELNDSIIKNTIIHEIIHCMPYCNNHGFEFKKYAKFINEKLGYNIATLGNKEEDYKKSNLEYIKEIKKYNYKIVCERCGEVYYRMRLNRGLLKKYRCGKCRGKLILED